MVKTIGWLKEVIKNHPDDMVVTLLVNGVEYPLTKALFSPDAFLMVHEGMEPTIVKQNTQEVDTLDKYQRFKNIDDSIRKNGVARKIESIRDYRVLTGCGLMEAKIYVEKILNIT